MYTKKLNKGGGLKAPPFSFHTFHFTAIHSISTKAPLGNVLTATAERAGKGDWKKEE